MLTHLISLLYSIILLRQTIYPPHLNLTTWHHHIFHYCQSHYNQCIPCPHPLRIYHAWSLSAHLHYLLSLVSLSPKDFPFDQSQKPHLSVLSSMICLSYLENLGIESQVNFNNQIHPFFRRWNHSLWGGLPKLLHFWQIFPHTYGIVKAIIIYYDRFKYISKLYLGFRKKVSFLY